MKKNLLAKFLMSLLAVIFFQALLFSQEWISINSGITDDISAVTYLDENTLYASCMDSSIYLSSDGGLNWSVSYTGTMDIPMQNITSPDENSLVSVGYEGRILRYDGTVWQNIPSGTTYSLTGISFADANTGYVVGENGTILKSTDGGLSWSDISFRFDQWIMAVHAYDNNHVMVVTAPGTLLVSDNGGASGQPFLYLAPLGLVAYL